MTGKFSMGKTLSTTLLVTVFLLCFAFQVYAADNVYYYQVQPGDNLWLIGWRFETTADAVINFNSLKSTMIYPGQALKIPSSTNYVRTLPQSVTYLVKTGDSLETIAQKFGTTVTSLKELNKLTSNATSVGQSLYIPLPPQKRYTVQPGETLFLLTKRFSSNIESLMLVNKMNTQTLWVGQVLFVPDNAPSQTTPNTQTPTPDTQTPTPDTQIPTPNTQTPTPDTQTPTPDTQIPTPNTQTPTPNTQTQPAPNVGTLPPAGAIDYSRQLTKIGQWGQIPAGVVLYHVQLGDNLWRIAQKYSTSISAIMKTNHLTSDLVQVNQPLFIPQASTQSVAIPYPTGLQNQSYGELLDWEYASWIADTHRVFTVKDMASGKTFTVRRYGGSNHLDAEPLTAADSAVMKEIFGEWTWISRPAFVYVEDKVLAASISGMPHSFDSISDNNFAGHFDIYFLNSRSHNNNSIINYHQKAVLKAAGVI